MLGKKNARFNVFVCLVSGVHGSGLKGGVQRIVVSNIARKFQVQGSALPIFDLAVCVSGFAGRRHGRLNVGLVLRVHGSGFTGMAQCISMSWILHFEKGPLRPAAPTCSSVNLSRSSVNLGRSSVNLRGRQHKRRL